MDVSIFHDDGQGGNRKVAVATDAYAFCPCTAVTHCESETTMVKRADDPEIFRCRKWAGLPGAEVPLPEGEAGYAGDSEVVAERQAGAVNQPADGSAPGLPTDAPEPVPTSAGVPVASGAEPTTGPLEFYGAHPSAEPAPEPTEEAPADHPAD